MAKTQMGVGKNASVNTIWNLAFSSQCLYYLQTQLLSRWLTQVGRSWLIRHFPSEQRMHHQWKGKL